MKNQIEKNEKRSGVSTQPSSPSANQKYSHILKRIAQICKRVKWERVALLVLTVLCIVLLLCLILKDGAGADATASTGTPTKDKTEKTAAGTSVRYELTDAERWEIASVVTAEAAGEPFEGKVAVAQCILQACEDDGIRPCEAVVTYRYAKSRPEPTEEALRAVDAVFKHGEVATSEPIKYFYAPALVYSEWHESQVYVMTIQGHKFFKEATE